MRSYLNTKMTIHLRTSFLPLLCVYAAFSCLNASAQDVSGAGIGATDAAASELQSVGLVRGDAVNVRSGSTTQSGVAGQLGRGTRVRIVGEEGEWHKVETQRGQTGWVHRDLLGIEQLSPEPAEGETGGMVQGTATLKVPVGRVRRMPSLQGEFLYNLEDGETVSVLDQRGDWYRIKTWEGRDGWAYQGMFDPLVIVPDLPQVEVKEITDIRVEMVSEEEEQVIFSLTDFFTPETFVVTGDNPKVICDFSDATIGEDVNRLIPVEGRLIREVRIEPRRESESGIRTTISLMADKNYQVQQVFHKQDQLYVLIVKPTK